MYILVIRNNYNAQATDASLLLASYFQSQGIRYELIDSSDLGFQDASGDVCAAKKTDADLVVVLGGDGTILRAARFVGMSGLPIIGINFGNLGFLANPHDDGVVAVVVAALAGDVVVEHRTNLRIDVACESEDMEDLFFAPYDSACDHDEDGEDASSSDERNADDGRRSFFALNELALTRGATGRIIDFDLGVSGIPIAHLRGDGIVVASATGSTAYALSAGGPLVAPCHDGLIVVPLAPHTLHSRAIVTESEDVVEVTISTTLAGREATLFVDGEPLSFGTHPVSVRVRKGDVPTKLLRYGNNGFYANASRVFF